MNTRFLNFKAVRVVLPLAAILLMTAAYLAKDQLRGFLSLPSAESKTARHEGDQLDEAGHDHSHPGHQEGNCKSPGASQGTSEGTGAATVRWESRHAKPSCEDSDIRKGSGNLASGDPERWIHPVLR